MGNLTTGEGEGYTSLICCPVCGVWYWGNHVCWTFDRAVPTVFTPAPVDYSKVLQEIVELLKQIKDTLDNKPQKE